MFFFIKIRGGEGWEHFVEKSRLLWRTWFLSLSFHPGASTWGTARRMCIFNFSSALVKWPEHISPPCTLADWHHELLMTQINPEQTIIFDITCCIFIWACSCPASTKLPLTLAVHSQVQAARDHNFLPSLPAWSNGTKPSWLGRVVKELWFSSLPHLSFSWVTWMFLYCFWGVQCG